MIPQTLSYIAPAIARCLLKSGSPSHQLGNTGNANDVRRSQSIHDEIARALWGHETTRERVSIIPAADA
jgi:hypothetical protein